VGRRRDADPRPEVEVLGVGPAPPLTQRVEVAGAPHSRRRGALIALGVAAVLGLGATLGSSEEPPEDDPDPASAEERTSTTTRPRPTSTATTDPEGATASSAAPPGPVLDVPTGGAYVVLADRGRLRWIELDTGTQGEADAVGLGDPWGSVPVRGGLVGIGAFSKVSFWSIPGDERRELGSADRVLPSGQPDQVWLLRHVAGLTERTSARLVDLDGTELLAIDLPVPWVDWGGDDRGLPMSVGGRTYFVDAGGVRPLAAGELIGWSRWGSPPIRPRATPSCPVGLVTSRWCPSGTWPRSPGTARTVAASGQSTFPSCRTRRPGCRATSGCSSRPQAGSSGLGSTASAASCWSRSPA
jgi:hypothetical protein